MVPSFLSLRSATQKTLFGRKPMWRKHASTSAEEMRQVGVKLQLELPNELVQFLVEFGFGDIDDELSFRKEWLRKLEVSPLAGHLMFGQDERGNFYTADPQMGAIHFMSRSEPGYCRLASNFGEFLEEAAARGFKMAEWAEAQPLVPYPSEA
jgi:hypothetical protein